MPEKTVISGDEYSKPTRCLRANQAVARASAFAFSCLVAAIGNRALFALASVLPAVLVQSAVTQRIDAQQIEPHQIREWVSDLDSDQLVRRNTSEQHLIQQGTPLLNWLEQAPNLESQGVLMTAEIQYRLERIRRTIFANSVERWGEASTVQIETKANAEQIMQAMQQQTGNHVTFDRSINWQGHGQGQPKTFWDSIRAIRQTESLSPDTQQSTGDKLVLTPITADQATPVGWSNFGILHVEWLSLGNAQGEQSNETPAIVADQVRARLWWEPRIHLLGIRIPMANVELKDEQGNDWARFNRDAVYSIPASPGQCFTNLRLPIQKNEDASRLTSLTFPVELKMVAPDAVCRFPNLLESERTGAPMTWGMARVVVESVESALGESRVRLHTVYDAQRMAQPLQSHIDWSRFCDARLTLSGRTADENLVTQATGARQIRQRPFSYTIEYTFPVSAAQIRDSGLIFRIPSGIISSDHNITFGAR